MFTKASKQVHVFTIYNLYNIVCTSPWLAQSSKPYWHAIGIYHEKLKNKFLPINGHRLIKIHVQQKLNTNLAS